MLYFFRFSNSAVLNRAQRYKTTRKRLTVDWGFYVFLSGNDPYIRFSLKTEHWGIDLNRSNNEWNYMYHMSKLAMYVYKRSLFAHTSQLNTVSLFLWTFQIGSVYWITQPGTANGSISQLGRKM